MSLPVQDSKNKHSLAIAVVVSVVLLVAAAAIAWWMILQKTSQVAPEEQKDPNDTSIVTSVSWVEPVMPASLAKRDQNTTEASTTYYTDTTNECGITTTIGSIAAGSAKDSVIQSITAADSLGIKTVSSVDGPSYTIKDMDQTHQYDFSSLQLVQSVNIQGVDFTEQQNVVMYKQFGQRLASISMACKTASWEAQKPALEALVLQFTVKTER